MSHPSRMIVHMFGAGEQGAGSGIPVGERADRGPAIDAAEAELAEWAGVVNAAQGRMVAVVARALDEELWVQSGIASPAHWLTWRLGVSPAHARLLVRVARRHADLPVTMAALDAGELSLDQVEVIARHVPATHDRTVAEVAKEATVPQLRRALRRYSFAAGDPTTAALEADGTERRRVGFGATDDGRWLLHADLPADEGAVVEQALAAAHHDLFHGAGGRADTEGAAQVTWADALLAVAEGSLAAGAARLPGADRYRVHLHLETSGLSLHLGDPLPDALRRLHTCDTTYVAVFEHEGRPIATAPARREISDRMRRAVEHRDGGCVVPGCDATRFLQIHHIVHVEDHGLTVTSNLVATCRRHHRQHHLGGLGITGDADRPGGLTFTDHRGRPLPTGPRPRPPTRLPAVERYRHPSGERLRLRHFDVG